MAASATRRGGATCAREWLLYATVREDGDELSPLSARLAYGGALRGILDEVVQVSSV